MLSAAVLLLVAATVATSAEYRSYNSRLPTSWNGHHDSSQHQLGPALDRPTPHRVAHRKRFRYVISYAEYVARRRRLHPEEFQTTQGYRQHNRHPQQWRTTTRRPTTRNNNYHNRWNPWTSHSTTQSPWETTTHQSWRTQTTTRRPWTHSNRHYNSWNAHKNNDRYPTLNQGHWSSTHRPTHNQDLYATARNSWSSSEPTTTTTAQSWSSSEPHTSTWHSQSSTETPRWSSSTQNSWSSSTTTEGPISTYSASSTHRAPSTTSESASTTEETWNDIETQTTSSDVFSTTSNTPSSSSRAPSTTSEYTSTSTEGFSSTESNNKLHQYTGKPTQMQHSVTASTITVQKAVFSQPFVKIEASNKEFENLSGSPVDLEGKVGSLVGHLDVEYAKLGVAAGPKKKEVMKMIRQLEKQIEDYFLQHPEMRKH